MAQRGQAGVAEQHVEAHGQHGHDGRLGEQRQGIRREQRRDAGRGDHGHQPDDDAATVFHVRPNSPVGRSARMSAIGANSVK